MHHQIVPLRSVSSIAHGDPEGYREFGTHQQNNARSQRSTASTGHGRRIATSLLAGVACLLTLTPAVSAEAQPKAAVPVQCEPGNGTYSSGCRLTPGRADGWFVPQGSIPQGSRIDAKRVPYNAR